MMARYDRDYAGREHFGEDQAKALLSAMTDAGGERVEVDHEMLQYVMSECLMPGCQSVCRPPRAPRKNPQIGLKSARYLASGEQVNQIIAQSDAD